MLVDADKISERKMFGGLAFLSLGHMLCGVVHDALMLRLGPDWADNALGEPHVRPMDFTGRPMQDVEIELDRKRLLRGSRRGDRRAMNLHRR